MLKPKMHEDLVCTLYPSPSPSKTKWADVYALLSIVLGVGEDEWDIDDLRTWKDANGEEKEPPMPDMDGLFLQVRRLEFGTIVLCIGGTGLYLQRFC